MQEPGATSTSLPEGAFPLVSLVWLQRASFGGLFQNQNPGLLIAREGGRISLVTLKEKVFEAEKHEIVARWPWYQFGQGVRLKVAGKTYRLSLARPPHTPDINLGERGGLLSTLAALDSTGISSLGRAFASGKAWKSYLNT